MSRFIDSVAPRYQSSQCDRLHVPFAADVPVVRATCGPRSQIQVDWWRIREPSKRLRPRVQWTKNSQTMIQSFHCGRKRKPTGAGAAVSPRFWSGFTANTVIFKAASFR